MSKVQRKRVITWEKRDARGNDWGFALVDFRAPVAVELEPDRDLRAFVDEPKHPGGESDAT
jgi:hypothetical protein